MRPISIAVMPARGMHAIASGSRCMDVLLNIQSSAIVPSACITQRWHHSVRFLPARVCPMQWQP
eukprot:9345758-Lingulodinium_polyedra.AAC.1